MKDQPTQPRFAWTPDALDTAERMWRDGWTAKNIGLALGTTKGAVLGRRRTLGWPTRVACPGADAKPVELPRRVSVSQRPVDVILGTVLHVSPAHAAELAAEYRLPWRGRRIDLRAINRRRDFDGLPPVWTPELPL